MSSAATKRSTLRLSEVARHVVIPEGIVSTGWREVRDQCAEFGDSFDTWQDGAGQVMLGKRKDGLYAATVGGITLSIPRQVAKTFLVGRIIFALCVLFPGLKVLWSAHRARTSTMTFRNLQGFARRKKVAPHISAIRTANGEQEIVFTNGSIIMFGAREQGFGRGFDEVDVEVFDEAQILTEKALEDMVAATNQSRHPHGALLFFMGTPPRPVDPGEAFTIRRDKALAGKSRDAVYIECSADQDADPDDHAQWEKANPSFPHRTPLASMLRLRENLPSDEAWLREALGIWDAVGGARLFPTASWSKAADEQSMPVDRLSLGIEVAPDLAWASVSLAGARADGDWHIELQDRRDGYLWVPDYVASLLDLNPQIRAVALDDGSPSKSLLEPLKKARVRTVSPSVRELGAACAEVLAGVVAGSVHHIEQHQLTAAAQVAGKRPLGDTGLWTYSRRLATSDITPILSATLALWAATLDKTKSPRIREGRGSGTREAALL